jgi:carbonic anhydrase/SulP family sulfate permease
MSPSPEPNTSLAATLPRDLTASVVVFLVALPLCLGIALASGAPLFAGVLAGIIGGTVVGLLSGSHTSVSGPAAGLAAVVAAEIASLGSFPTFLLALVFAGVIQIALGLVRAGFLAAFFPSSVIKGLLAAIGVLLILKQLPHLLGRDADPEGDMAFFQFDHENTFSELVRVLADNHPGAAAIGLISLGILVLWDRTKALKSSIVPAPLIVVVVGVGLSLVLRRIGAPWSIQESHLVQVPVTESVGGFVKLLQAPDFSQWNNAGVYFAALTIAAVASLETLLNLEAIDKIDPRQRTSPPSRELFAQGVGNVLSGLVGGIPLTSVIVRSSVNINAGNRTKLSAIVHGVLLLVSVMLFPSWLNLIPLSCLAAILLVTGVKLASPALIRRMWDEGRYQFIPFAVTLVAIVLTDLLVGILIGLAVSLGFILNSNMRRPLRRFVEKHLGGDVLHIELANQVSFLNRASLSQVLDGVPRDGHVLIDAQNTDYIDPDVLDLIRDYSEKTGPARGVSVSLLGFRRRYQLEDQIQYVDYSTRELQSGITPEQVLKVLMDGNERFRAGRQLTRDLGRQVHATAAGQHPLAVVLSCIDSRTPTELVFDLGVGDIFSIRIAGNVTSRKVLGSIEYACAVAGAKLILVMGHTRCTAVTTALRLIDSTEPVAEATGCQHLDPIIVEIQKSIDIDFHQDIMALPDAERLEIIAATSRRHAQRVVGLVREESQTIDRLIREGRVALVGAMYDVVTGRVELMPEAADEPGPAANRDRSAVS